MRYEITMYNLPFWRELNSENLCFNRISQPVIFLAFTDRNSLNKLQKPWNSLLLAKPV